MLLLVFPQEKDKHALAIYVIRIISDFRVRKNEANLNSFSLFYFQMFHFNFIKSLSFVCILHR